MHLLDAHSLGQLYRLVHLAGMAILLGGSAVLAILPQMDPPVAISLASRYERLFWIVAGTQVLTGIGNLGVRSPGLPPPDSPWTQALLTKLTLVLAVLVLSAFRAAFVARLEAHTDAVTPLGWRALQRLYSATAMALLAVVWLAARVAHG